jgi:hypothetical protein
MTPTGEDPVSERLLHCSLDRTLVLRQGADGRPVVRKVLLRGSPVDAEREARLGRLAAMADVVPYVDAGVDADSGRPFVQTAFLDGPSLDRLVADHGAPTAGEAASMLLPVAHTLAALHALRTPELPQGLCHGDVKPANLIRVGTTTVLLDFEHAGPIGQGACGGTAGFAGPEAQTGAPLEAAFDVFGLGASMRWLLAGGACRSAAAAVQPPSVRAFLTRCAAPAPAARPTAAQAQAMLAQIVADCAADPLASARALLLGGEPAACLRQLAELDDAESARLRRAAERQRARLQRLGADFEDDLVTDPAAQPTPALTQRILRLWRALRRMPGNRRLHGALQACRQAATMRLAERLADAMELARKERFADAQHALAGLAALWAAADRVVGPRPLAPDESASMPSLLARSPQARLEQEQRRLQALHERHEGLLAAMAQAEAALSLADAASVLDQIAEALGGASEAVARRRDRLHRWTFYVERAAQSERSVERLRDLLGDGEVEPLIRLAAECADAVSALGHGETAPERSIGLRSLQLALDNLDAEFPALQSRVAPARAALQRMLASATDECWALLSAAKEKLQMEPVPVRPLQLLLSRLDTFRLLEAVIDRPERDRSALHDGIEDLRLRIEQAQATRDRLARGAEQALAKGHWTTGLFEMERAARHLEAGDELQERQAAQLRQRLEQARRRKQEVEEAARKNHELQARCLQLQDDPASTTQERQQALRERRDCLQFLMVHSQEDRAELYARDLRDCELDLLLERSQQSEAELDLASGLEAAAQIADDALRAIVSFAQDWQSGGELPGRLARTLERWQRRKAAVERDLQAAAAARRQSRRRRVLAAADGAAALLLAVCLQWLSDSSAAAGARPPAAGSPQSADLPAGAQQAAERLVREAWRLGVETRPDVLQFVREAESETARYLEAIAASGLLADPRALATAGEAWDRLTAAARRHDGDADVAAQAIAAATARLRALGLPR